MQTAIKITFPVRKKGKPDTCKVIANCLESGGSYSFTLNETKRDLDRQRHTVTEGCIIEDLISGKSFKCINVSFTERPITPIMIAVPI